MNGHHISLFAGVGMTDIAAEAAGFKTIATAEIEPFCRSVLQRRFPSAKHFEDVRDVEAHALPPLERPLLVSGGFPCQDVSASGTALGLSGERSGLWVEFLRVIRDLMPDFVLIENSPLLRSRGLDRILIDLHQAGYIAEWDCIPAAAIGAPHLRDRIYITAKIATTYGMAAPAKRLPRAGRLGNDGGTHESVPLFSVSSAKRPGLLPTPTRSDGNGGPGTTWRRAGGKNLRTVIAEQYGNGRLNPEFVEWMMGLPLGWTDPQRPLHRRVTHSWHDGAPVPATVPAGYPDRGKRVRALGNGLVPQAAGVALERLTVTP